ncbi:hypothetical protein [Portibacter lacus]|uniref:Lipoprotein n=1 Tax=Portibacter lacus TaxID=1099794 RepID=A0AA37WFK8_9BACT|nr:hypothetical protein [Portibacter lacus]GLR18747.1 hypothetical protein GCM10007940_33630 [Portibacter lacus]
MKNFTIIIGIATMVFFSACTSLEKMVDNGNYDEAIVKLARKLSGKKNKKAKDLKMLEEAFQKVTAEDLAYAERLKTTGRASNWDEIFNIYQKIDDRQDLIMPFLPLVSKDGYRAKFNFANVNSLKNEAANNATAYHYNEAIRLIALGKKGDKRAARQAYDGLETLEQYTDQYKDSRSLKEEAQFLGTNRVLVKLYNNTFGFMPREVEEEIMSVNVKELNTFWTQYYTKSSLGYDFDYVARLDVDNIDISPEREYINRYIDEKEIKDGWQYALDEKGNVKKDSLGNDIKVDKYVKVVAQVIEINRQKSATASGRFGLFDAETKELIETRPFSVDAHFSDFASSMTGDRRAISDRTRGRIKNYPSPFPSDLLMTMDVAYELKELMKTEMRRFAI